MPKEIDMPAQFIKSLFLTLLIAFQIGSTNVTLSIVEDRGLPKDLFIWVGSAIFLVGIIVYAVWAQRFVKKSKPCHNE